MSGINLLKRMAVVAALVVTIAGAAIATASAPGRGTGTCAGMQVVEKGSSDGQETHG